MSLLTEAFSEESLLEAWRKVRARNSAPGVDGVTVSGFGRLLDRNLACIRRDAMAGSYRPDPLLRRHIPKADGDFRRIGIPTVRDRVAQRALLNSMLDRIEPNLHPSSYAYRPGRSVAMAVAQIEGWRDEGAAWVARADIDLCFDTIPRSDLLREIPEWIGDAACGRLISRWLDAGYIDGDEYAVQSAGVPQGDILSPVLSNIYLDSFDRQLAAQHERFVRYADDILVVSKDRQAANLALGRASRALSDVGLALDKEKSRTLSFAGGFRYLGTLFVRSMALPAIRIERSDGTARYVSGYEPTGPVQLSAKRDGSRVVVSAEGGSITEHRLSRMVAKELYMAKRGRGTAVGLALLEAWREHQERQREDDSRSPLEPAPGEWAFVA